MYSNISFAFSGLCKELPLSMPFFTSQANTYRAQVGNSVTLFCQVENLGKSFIILNSIEFYSEKKTPISHTTTTYFL